MFANAVQADKSLRTCRGQAPFVGITDAGLVPGGGTGPIGWETYQPVTQLWLYKYSKSQCINRSPFLRKSATILI